MRHVYYTKQGLLLRIIFFVCGLLVRLPVELVAGGVLTLVAGIVVNLKENQEDVLMIIGILLCNTVYSIFSSRVTIYGNYLTTIEMMYLPCVFPFMKNVTNL